jgi:FdhE protein
MNGRFDGARLDHLTFTHPEWRPWIEVLGRALREADDPVWQSFVPLARPARAGNAPLLAEAVIGVDPGAVRRWVHLLFGTAAGVGYSTAFRMAETGVGSAEAVAILEAAVCQDAPRLGELAGSAPSQALRAIAEVAALPLLQACGRRWAGAVPPTWREGYCPVCGAWPALAEARGIERRRRLRCARCGSDWTAEPVRCVFCGRGEAGGPRLLIEDVGGARWRVETCSACGGYLKTLSSLGGSPGSEIVLDDLASVDLDFAALSEGYSRPAGRAFPINARLIPERSGAASRFGPSP